MRAESVKHGGRSGRKVERFVQEGERFVIIRICSARRTRRRLCGDSHRNL